MNGQIDPENVITYFARTNFRNQMTKFGIKTDDRRRHMYVIGKTGMGKTTLMENMILADIYAGHGCCYVDPHGDTAEKLIDFIPSWRINDVVYFNPADMDFPIGFNILEAVDERHKHLVASGMMGVFKKIWENMWSARMEYILNNSILALMDNPGSTLLGINRMFSDDDYRNRIVSNVKDPIVKAFWVKEYASYSERYATEAVAAIQNKIGQFLSATVIRNIVAQVKSTMNMREIMDNKKILIVNLSKGRVGEDTSRLLGGMLITKIQLAAMERVDIPEEERKDFFLYVDEFQNFAVESFAGILSEARKYRLSLIMAHQYIAQLSDEVREAVFGNVGSLIAFRVGAPDAEFLEKEFTPRFLTEDIINLPKFNIYLKLLIDGVTSQPFSASTLPPIALVTHSTDKVVRVTRERYARPRGEIEEKILKWSGMGEDADIEGMLKEAEDKKKAEKKGRGKPRHEYNCTRCNTQIVLPVELDRSRPIYCEDCIKIVRDERKKGKDKKPAKATISSERGAKASSQPKPSDGEAVEIIPDEPSISLKEIMPKKEEPKVEPAEKKEEPKAEPPPKKEEPPAQEKKDLPNETVPTSKNENEHTEEKKKRKRRKRKKPADTRTSEAQPPAESNQPSASSAPSPTPPPPQTDSGSIRSGESIKFD